jgi:hypothetical protein
VYASLELAKGDVHVHQVVAERELEELGPSTKWIFKDIDGDRSGFIGTSSLFE